MRVPFAGLIFSGLLAFAGCASMPNSNTSSMNPQQGVAITGRVHGGQNPISGAHVYLLAVNTTGYGGPGIAASSANMSASLLTNGAGQDSLGYYVTTDSNGNFNITGDYTCPSTWANPYLYAVGGDSGSGPNTAITLIAPVSSCPSASEFITVNEISTIASVYALAGFASDPTHVSSSGSALDAISTKNAENTIQNLENANTGVANATTPGGNGTVPQAEIDTLANILAACVNSTGSGSTQCSTLFSNATNGGTQAADTATAAVNIAHNPGANVSNLIGLQTPSSPFQPMLSATPAPNDFTIAVFYTGGGMNDPLGLAIDNAGDVWATNTNGGANSLSEFSPVGVAISGTGGFTGGGLNTPYGIAIDLTGNAWVVNSGNNTLSEFSSSGTPVSTTAYSGGGLTNPTNICIDAGGNLWINNGFANNISELSSSGVAAMNSPFSGGGIDGGIDIACDAAGHVWISNSSAVLGELTTSGAVVTSGGYTGGGLDESYGVAVDSSGNVWTANDGNNSISKFNSSGAAQSGSDGYTGGGLSSPQYIAVDSAGNVWVANEGSHSISEFTSSGTAVTGLNGYQLPTTAVTREIAIDGSGNIWVTSYDVNILTELVGLASPVVTPIVGGLAGSPISPSITNIQPNPAAVGTSVTITGTNFGATQGGSSVTFNGTTASPTNWSATSVTVPVPAGATTGNVIVTVGGLPSNGYSFTVGSSAPNITNIQPNPAAVGTPVTITGTNFGATQGGSTVTFAGTSASPTSWSATSITTTVPVGATTGNVVVTVGGQASTGYPFTVSGGTMPGDVITWRYDNSLDGLNSNETTLTTANVNSTTFGKVGEFTVNGRIDGEILYLSQISISGVMKNVIYFATENDVVYAVDADSISGSTATVLWSTSLVPSGEAPAIPNQTGATCGNVSPQGVQGTPVIDRGRNAIYAVSKTMNSTTNTTQYFRIHALDLTNGNELFGGPTTVSATYPGTGGNASGGVVTFSARDQSNRPGLLETGGNIYVAFGGQDGDCGLYSGWLISYNADTLEQGDAIDLNPNSSQGGMWNSGASPSADAAGAIYVATANTGDDNSIGPNDYPISIVKLADSGTLAVSDYFTPYNAEALDQDDLDLGSAGVLILPDLMDNESVVHQYAVAAGKDGNMYVADRDNLGQFHMSTNDNVQTIAINGSGSAHENFSTPAYFNNNVYVCPSGEALKAFAISNALLATTATMSTTTSIGTSGFTISANGTSNGIVWAIQPAGNGVLYAFNASSLSTMLYASNQAAGNRDQTAQILGSFHTPTVANGKVYFGTGSTVAVFGLLP
jgi:streptogramin lyase